jgi:hypothetical protein
MCIKLVRNNVTERRRSDLMLVIASFYALLNSAPRHEDILGSGGIAPRILILGTR